MEHNFYKLKQRLQEQGWYVAWAHPCCQTCAWQEVPYEHPDGPNEGKELDWNKLLFNHEQDCNMECEYDEENDEYILPDGMTKDDYCTFPTYKPEQTSGSLFCFNGDEQGVKNLIEVLPIIEESGCTWSWNKTGNARIYIGW
jgi:hypothetical protein